MPNRNYEKGRRKEYKVVNFYKSKGYIAFRSAGSHSPIDVVAIKPEICQIWLIQCKPDNMTEKNKNKLKKENKALNGLFKVRFEVL